MRDDGKRSERRDRAIVQSVACGAHDLSKRRDRTVGTHPLDDRDGQQSPRDRRDQGGARQPSNGRERERDNHNLRARDEVGGEEKTGRRAQPEATGGEYRRRADNRDPEGEDKRAHAGQTKRETFKRLSAQ